MQNRRAVSTIVVVIAVIIAVACVGIVSYTLYQKSLEDARIREQIALEEARIKYENSLQPNIQPTANSITTPIKTPHTNSVVNQGRVSTSGSFSHKATIRGNYYLIFDNSFSTFSSKDVHLIYSTSSPVTNYDTTFNVPADSSHYVTVPLSVGQQLSGSFSITGGAGNDVNFNIQVTTYTQWASFKCTLVNAGTSDGFANVAFTVDGASVWSNKYFIAMGGSLPISDSVTINDGDSHSFDIIVVNQYKP